MDVFELAIHGTGYPLPGGYDGTCALCITTSGTVCGIEFFTTLVVRDAEPFWRHSHVERGDDEKTDFNVYPYAKPQPTTTPHHDS